MTKTKNELKIEILKNLEAATCRETLYRAYLNNFNLFSSVEVAHIRYLARDLKLFNKREYAKIDAAFKAAEYVECHK
jgi:hypothetical protein